MTQGLITSWAEHRERAFGASPLLFVFHLGLVGQCVIMASSLAPCSFLSKPRWETRRHNSVHHNRCTGRSTNESLLVVMQVGVFTVSAQTSKPEPLDPR